MVPSARRSGVGFTARTVLAKIRERNQLDTGQLFRACRYGRSVRNAHYLEGRGIRLGVEHQLLAQCRSESCAHETIAQYRRRLLLPLARSAGCPQRQESEVCPAYGTHRYLEAKLQGEAAGY